MHLLSHILQLLSNKDNFVTHNIIHNHDEQPSQDSKIPLSFPTVAIYNFHNPMLRVIQILWHSADSYEWTQSPTLFPDSL